MAPRAPDVDVDIEENPPTLEPIATASLSTLPPPTPPRARSRSCSRSRSSRRNRYSYCCGLFTPVHVDDCVSSTQHSHSSSSYDTDSFSSSSSSSSSHHAYHPSGIGLSTTFWTAPLLGPLLFTNESSDARDHAASERTFLSYLRLSIYMAVVAVAITLSFHLKRQPTDVELRMARPLGLIFWLLAVACLTLGLGNYINTLNKYSRKAAIVQTGWRTQGVLSLIVLAIVGTCIVLLVVAKVKVDYECDQFLDSDCAAKVHEHAKQLAGAAALQWNAAAAEWIGITP